MSISPHFVALSPAQAVIYAKRVLLFSQLWDDKNTQIKRRGRRLNKQAHERMPQPLVCLAAWRIPAAHTRKLGRPVTKQEWKENIVCVSYTMELGCLLSCPCGHAACADGTMTQTALGCQARCFVHVAQWDRTGWRFRSCSCWLISLLGHRGRPLTSNCSRCLYVLFSQAGPSPTGFRPSPQGSVLFMKQG